MRAPRQGGDVLTIGTVAGASTKPYPLAPVAQNISYETESDQPEARPNQPLSVPISFHNGIGYSEYDPQVAGSFTGHGVLGHEPNVIGAARKSTTVTLTGAANPPMYFFEADVNDAGADNGRPRLFVIACEAAEINVYKISLAYGYTATGTGVTTDTGAKTLTDARATWSTNEWVGEIVTCNSQTLTITSNTATVLTGTGGWSGDPGDGNAYKIGVGTFGTLLNTKTFSVTPTQPMGRPALWYDGTNTEWRLGTGDTTNDIQSLSSIVSGTGADTWGTDDADARHLHMVGEKLYRTTGNNEVSILARNTNPESEANWADEFYVGSDAIKITDIGEAGGLCYIAKEDGLYEWDGEGDADNIFPAIGYGERNGQGMAYWHGGFLIPTKSGLWWTRTGKPMGPDSNPNYRARHAPLDSNLYVDHGRWNGLAPIGEYIYATYATSGNSFVLWGRERDPHDPSGWGPIIWHVFAQVVADLDDFHGVYASKTSEFKIVSTVAEVRPCLWATTGNNISYFFLDPSGAPTSKATEIDTEGGPLTIRSGDITFGLPRVLKQLRVIDGWSENAATNTSWQLALYRDNGSKEDVGAAITTSGYFERFWTQDTNDTARHAILEFEWSGADTDTSGPQLRDVTMRAVALPDTTNVWTFLVAAEDDGKTAKLIRTEMEGYKNDLLKFELPDGDSFNGVLTGIRMLRANEIRELAVDRDAKGKALPLPRYIMVATVRELVSS